MFKKMYRLADLHSDPLAFFYGLLASFVGFFVPIKDIIHLLIVFFIIDVFVGFWAAKKTRGEKFSTPLIWKTTIPRMILSILVVMLAYGWDTVFEINIVSTYKTIGWFIAGILFYSIMKNAYKITKWYVFPELGKVIQEKLKFKNMEDVEDEEGYE